MGKYFGTDGFRGLVNENLTAIHAYKIGEFLASYYIKECGNKKFVIGRDTRISGYMLESALSAGLNSCGGDAYILGVTTTPSVAFLAKTKGFACGIMISASHNPYYDNGIKLINSSGEKMDESVISLIEAYIDGDENVNICQKDKLGMTFDYSNGKIDYVSHLTNLAPNLKGLNIGLDLANGSATASAKAVFDTLGATTTIINSNPDGLNINTNCGSTHIEGLAKLIKDKHLDCGFAYDGDADRCLMVDEYGNILSGDHILYIYANYLKEKNELKNNTVVTTVMSNFGLYKALDEKNISYAKTKVGDKYVYEYMKENDCIIGGEQSGHIIFIKHASTGDGILTSLKMLEVMVNTNKKLSELVDGLNIYPQVLINVKVTDKKKAQADPDVVKVVKDVEQELGDTGRILVRESGTEPLVRVMVEAKSQDICLSLANNVVNVIKSKGYEA